MQHKLGYYPPNKIKKKRGFYKPSARVEIIQSSITKEMKMLFPK